MAARTDSDDRDEGEIRPCDEAALAANVSALVTPPLVCAKMFSVVHSASASAEEIGAIVAIDPNLTARLLRIVNSSFYGFPSRIDTIARAVTILGTNDLYNLVLAISAARSFAKIGSGLVRTDAFWRHSVYCALVARELAKQCSVPAPDRLFVAGLLHDVGSCVIYGQREELALAMRCEAQRGEPSLYVAEREQFGFSHASIGALVLEQWQLPAELLAAARYHHDPGAAGPGRTEAALVHIADTIANCSPNGALIPNAELAPPVDPVAWEILATTPQALDLQQVLADADAGLADTLDNLL